MKRHFKRAFFAFLLVSSVFTFSQRAFATVTGWYGYHAHSGMEEIYGDYVNSESFSLLDTQEDYDPGFLEFFWDWHLRSETEVQNSQGTVTASSQTPASVAAWVGVGNVSLDLNESVEALAWTNTQSTYSPDVAKTADISFYSDSGFGLPAGLVGTVNYYFGIWENELIFDNFMLNEKDGWTLSGLDYQGENYTILRQTYSLGSGTISPDPTVWSLDLEVGQDYNFFAYMVAEAEFVPEPMTIVLLGFGGLFLRRRK